MLKRHWNPTRFFFFNCWHKSVARSYSVLGLSPSCDSKWNPVQLPAGRSDKRSKEVFSGRKRYPKYYPYGASKMADVAEPGRTSHAEEHADVL